MFKEITKDNWLLFAQHHYDNPTLQKEQEFYDDIKRFKYLKRLFRKYKATKNIKIRLVLNHVIVLANVFERERKAYTVLHRFIFNLKRILKRVGLGSRIGSFAVALALLIKENKEYEQHKLIIESAIITYLKQTNQYDNLLNEEGEVPTFEPEQDVFCNCFGIDVYELEDR